jgi:hypothetical protein
MFVYPSRTKRYIFIDCTMETWKSIILFFFLNVDYNTLYFPEYTWTNKTNISLLCHNERYYSFFLLFLWQPARAARLPDPDRVSVALLRRSSVVLVKAPHVRIVPDVIRYTYLHCPTSLAWSALCLSVFGHTVSLPSRVCD